MTVVARQNGEPYVKDGLVYATFSDETSLRQSLAAIAYAWGWTVQQEVVVPGWGRIDIVLHEPGLTSARLVELKVDLSKPAKIRRAFQQADGYGRWWSANRGADSSTYLVGADVDETTIASVGDLYPAVNYLDCHRFMACLRLWGEPERRTAPARRRTEQLRTRLAVHEAALNELDWTPAAVGLPADST